MPDFYIKSLDLFIEAKGKFTPKDRSKHLKVRESNPDVSIVLLFMRNNWLTKKKVVRYSGWCERHKIEYHIDVDGKIPERWLYVP